MNLDVSWVVKPIFLGSMIRKVEQIDCGDDVDEKQATLTWRLTRYLMIVVIMLMIVIREMRAMMVIMVIRRRM